RIETDVTRRLAPLSPLGRGAGGEGCGGTVPPRSQALLGNASQEALLPVGAGGKDTKRSFVACVSQPSLGTRRGGVRFLLPSPRWGEGPGVRGVGAPFRCISCVALQGRFLACRRGLCEMQQ